MKQYLKQFEGKDVLIFMRISTGDMYVCKIITCNLLEDVILICDRNGNELHINTNFVVFAADKFNAGII